MTIYHKIGLLALVIIAAWLRFSDLSKAPFRADELNMYTTVERGASVVDLWKNPPWMNQIPSAETLALISSRFFHEAQPEFAVRFPFALAGWLTVLLCGIIAAKWFNWNAAILTWTWMAVNPFHVYESREAYYYALLMFASAGGSFITVTMLHGILEKKNPSRKLWIFWIVWILAGCHSHMSFWIFAAIQWVCLLFMGVRHLKGNENYAYFLRSIAVATVVIAVFMIRWVYRAIKEIMDVADRGGHLGEELFWVLPRLLPMYAGGVNWVGIMLVLFVLVVFVLSWRLCWKDNTYRMLSLLLWGGLVVSLIYVMLVGGGKAKFTYFASYWPLFIIWASSSLAAGAERLGRRNLHAKPVFIFIILLLLLFLLGEASLNIKNLEGKPTPYRVLQRELDARLPTGSVVVVDRWYEPWNEMAVHAPTNVFVTFTVPDEPYEAFVQNRWRDVTRQYIEQGHAQGYILLTRNHHRREGVWDWPAQYFARSFAVTNQGGLWLRKHGFAPTGDFYDDHTNRLVVHVYYDLPEDRIARARAEGKASLVITGPEWNYMKPWQQTGQFQDYRVLADTASLDLYNLTGKSAPFELALVGVAIQGAKDVKVGSNQIIRFPPDRMVKQRVPLTLEPGSNSVVLADAQGAASRSRLLVARFSLEPVAEP